MYLTPIILLALVQALTHFGVVYSDSKDYFSLTKYLEGARQQPPSSIALAARPLLPTLAIPLDLIVGLPIAYGIINTLLWISSAVILFYMTRRIFKCSNSSLYAGLLLSTLWPIVLYGAASMTEVVGLFGTLLAVYMTLWIVDKEPPNLHAFTLGLFAGVLTLSREVVLVALASALLLLTYKRKYRYLAYFLVPWIAIIFLYQSVIYVLFNVNYITHFLTAGIGYTERRGLLSQWFNPFIIAKALLLGHVPAAWLTTIIGFLREKHSEVLVLFYILFFPSIVAFVVWPFHDLRIAVLVYHATIPLAGAGLKWLCDDLSSKPAFNILPSKAWAFLIIIVSALASDYLTYINWGCLSFPWNIYLFAPSSLRV